MIDALATRWETFGVVAGAIVLAVWALRDPTQEEATQPGTTASLRIEVRRSGEPPEVVDVQDGCLLGRGRDCTLSFDDPTVSKWHARLHFNGRAAFVEDLSSTNGTYLNGRRVDGTAVLRHGDRIDLGPDQIIFKGVARAADSP